MKRNESEARKRKRSKRNRGITLIALVLTIVILIILATITINFAFGDNGLIKRAEEARDYYENGVREEEEILGSIDEYIEGTTRMKFAKVAAGYDYSLGIDKDGNLWEWGRIQIGYNANDITLKSTPEQIKAGTKFQAISTGGGISNEYSLAIDEEGNLWAWGDNQWSQLGDGTTEDKTTPVQIKAGTKFQAISTGRSALGSHSLGIDEAGNLWAWGDNGSGQLGDGTTEDKTTPVQIKAGTTFKAISTGDRHSLAIDEAGNLWSWGNNQNGKLGDGTTENKTTPIQIKEGTKFKAISAGSNYSLAIDEAGNLWAWGDNSYGQIGNGSAEGIITTPVQIKNETTFQEIAVGNDHSLALDTEGNLWVCGSNSYAQIGNVNAGAVLNKTEHKFEKISIRRSARHSLAIDGEGNLWAWGDNGLGQLGDGTTEDKRIPVQIKAGTKFKEVSAGDSHSLAIDEAGNLWAWGDNSVGQVGNGSTERTIATPVQIAAGTTFQAISAGDSHSLAIDEAGNLWAWGDNGSGQLGDGSIENKSTPVQIRPEVKFKLIEAGEGTYAIDEENNVWGSNLGLTIDEWQIMK